MTPGKASINTLRHIGKGLKISQNIYILNNLGNKKSYCVQNMRVLVSSKNNQHLLFVEHCINSYN